MHYYLKLTLSLFIFSAFIVSLYGLYQWHIKVPPLALWDDPDSNYKITRVYSFLGNPNLLGGYLLPTLAFTGFMFFEATTASQPPKTLSTAKAPGICYSLNTDRPQLLHYHLP